MRRAHRDHDHRTAAMRPGSVGCVRNRRKLSHPVSPVPPRCQPAGVPGPAQHIRCQSGAAAARWGALLRALAPSPLRRVAGPARRGRAPADGHVVAGLVAGLRNSGPDAGDPAESPGHKPPSLAADRRASVRACSYHASPGASQRNNLCMDLWAIWVNAQVSHFIAVDARGCGKVDNRTAQSCQAAALRCPRGRWCCRFLPPSAPRPPDRRRQGTGRCIAAQATLAASCRERPKGPKRGDSHGSATI
jgi:hypothetical protein